MDRKNLVWKEEENLVGYKEDGEWFFPPLDLNLRKFDLNQNIFCGFPNVYSKNSIELDRQYIYSSTQFFDLSGSRWKVFRKNTRKYSARFGQEDMVYRLLKIGEREQEISELLLNWGKERNVQDFEVMVSYLFWSGFRWGLFNKDKLVGVNVADENWKYICFRYILDEGIPFLNEYLRLLFYQNLNSVFSFDKEINDGGDLDSEGLSFYKKKLNPCRIEKVYSYKKMDDFFLFV